MTRTETITRDSRSYRQGLVLGLTMAEVFLLLVFALLIALASLWKAEHKRRIAAELRRPDITAPERATVAKLEAAIETAGRDKVDKALAALSEKRNLQSLAPNEWTFVEQMRERQKGTTPREISDQWRSLTRATQTPDLPERLALADAVRKAYPDIKDRKRITDLIGQGLAADKRGEHDWPPIINLSEAEGYYFTTGKADIRPDFERLLRDVIVPQLVQLAHQYNVGTIEVIGHTDEQPIVQRPSNLDAMLLNTLNDKASVSSLIPADNAGLGLARAVAVTHILKEDDRLNPYTILPLSGGELITPADQLTAGGGGADKSRRRIEIRLRRSNPAKLAPGQSPYRNPQN